MPARSFKVTIENTSGYTLRKIGEHIDSGDFTDGWGAPPESIAPGATIAFQGESDAALRGTQGEVVYQVLSNQENHGSFGIKWEAPYVGNSSYELEQGVGRYSIDEHGNFVPDPDPAEVVDPTDFKVELDIGSGTWDGVPNDGSGHSTLTFKVLGLLEGFQTPEPAHYDRYPNPTLGSWSSSPGLFADASVGISIAPHSGGSLATVTVKDQGSVTVAPLALTMDVDLTAAPPPHRPPPVAERDTVVASAATAASPVKPTSVSVERQLQRGHTNASGQPPQGGERQAVEVHSNAPVIAGALHRVQDSIAVGQQVVLTLLKQTNGTENSTMGRALQYQRFNALGVVIRQELCPYQPPPPR